MKGGSGCEGAQVQSVDHSENSFNNNSDKTALKNTKMISQKTSIFYSDFNLKRVRLQANWFRSNVMCVIIKVPQPLPTNAAPKI